jgi:hypothetical protein
MESMDMMKVEGTNMMEKHDHPTNHRLEEDGMNMVEEHYHPMNHRLEVRDVTPLMYCRGYTVVAISHCVL